MTHLYIYVHLFNWKRGGRNGLFFKCALAAIVQVAVCIVSWIIILSHHVFVLHKHLRFVDPGPILSSRLGCVEASTRAPDLSQGLPGLGI